MKTAVRTVLKQQVELALLLEWVTKLDDRWVIEVRKNASFNENLLNSTFSLELMP